MASSVVAGLKRILRFPFPSSSFVRARISINNSGFCTITNSSPPRLMLPPAIESHKTVYQFYNLAENKVESLISNTKQQQEEEKQDETKFIGSSHGWLASFNSHTNNLLLSNPLTHRHIKLTPPPTINTLLSEKEEEKDRRRRSLTVSKLILSCSPDDEQDCRALISLGDTLAFCTITNTSTTTDWTLIGHLDYDEHDRDNYYYDCDVPIKLPPPRYDDIVYSPTLKRFFCVTSSDALHVWDDHLHVRQRVHNLSGSIVESDGHDDERRHWNFEYSDSHYSVEPEVRRFNHLVVDERSGELFVVRRNIMARAGMRDERYVRPIYYGPRRGWDDSFPYKTIGFHVYRIEGWRRRKKTCRLNPLRIIKGDDSLGGLAMFVGLNHSFAMSAADDGFCELKPESIYFTDALNEFTPSKRVKWADDDELPHPTWAEKMYGGHDIGIFSYKSRSFSPCHYPIDVQSMKRITPSPVWFTSSPH